MFRYLLAYISMRLDGAGPVGAKQYARNQVRIARRRRIETMGRV
jgi:hypothetical protein